MRQEAGEDDVLNRRINAREPRTDPGMLNHGHAHVGELRTCRRLLAAYDNRHRRLVHMIVQVESRSVEMAVLRLGHVLGPRPGGIEWTDPYPCTRDS